MTAAASDPVLYFLEMLQDRQGNLLARPEEVAFRMGAIQLIEELRWLGQS